MNLEEIDVKVHCSSLHKFMTGNFGLSEKETEKLEEYKLRRAGKYLSKKTDKPLGLSPDMEKHEKHLIDKRDNPKIGESGRTNIRKAISRARFDHYDKITTKEMEHGDAWEIDSIEMINSVLGTKLTKYTGPPREDKDLLLIGTPDVVATSADVIVDVKNPWNNETFDDKMVLDFAQDFEALDFSVDSAYWWQAQGYLHLWDKEHFFLVYTLNEHKYMEPVGKGSHYQTNFSKLDRMFCQYIARDKDAIPVRYGQRVPAIKKEIDLQKQIIKLAYARSRRNLKALGELLGKHQKKL